MKSQLLSERAVKDRWDLRFKLPIIAKTKETPRRLFCFVRKGKKLWEFRSVKPFERTDQIPRTERVEKKANYSLMLYFFWRRWKLLSFFISSSASFH